MLRLANLRAWRRLTPPLWRIGWPESTLLLVGYANELVLVRFSAGLGQTELAANRALEAVTLVPFTAVVVCGTAVATLAGQRLGAGEPDAADHARRAGRWVAAAVLAVPALPLLVRPDLVLGLLTPDRVVIATGAAAAPLAVASLIPLVFAVTTQGVLRAAGDTRAVLVASVISDYAVLLPLAWLCAFPLGLGLSGIYLGWVGYALAFAAMLSLRHHGGHWRTRAT